MLPAGANTESHASVAVSPYVATAGTLNADSTVLQLNSHTGSNSNAKPTESVVFNNPYGSLKEQRAIADTIAEGIDNAPAGSTVRLAAFSFTLPDFADTVIAAKNRGVNVYMITDNHSYEGTTSQAKETKQLERLKKELGTNVTTGKGSYIKICEAACLGDGSSIMHVKLSLFQRTGGSEHVTMISSYNPDDFQNEAWNNIVKLENDKKVYNKMVQYFDDMAKEPGKGNWYSKTTSGKNTIITYPNPDYSSLKDDQHYIELSKVKCAGKIGPAEIDVAMFQWTDTRLAVAQKLSELATSGCKVRVIVSKANASPKILLALKSNSKIAVADADANIADGKPGIFSHNKVLLIDPKEDSKRTGATVVTGSQNFSVKAMKENAELTLVNRDPEIYDKFATQQNLIWRHSRLMKVAKTK